jgi:hypothetical protein
MLAIYAPMIYTTPRIMFLMRADPLRGQVGGGWALEIEGFLGPVKWHRADRRVPFRAQKLPIFDSFWGKKRGGERSIGGHRYCVK